MKLIATIPVVCVVRSSSLEQFSAFPLYALLLPIVPGVLSSSQRQRDWIPVLHTPASIPVLRHHLRDYVLDQIPVKSNRKSNM